MSWRAASLLWIFFLLGNLANAQDSKFPPSDQQIPAPGCLEMKALWEGGYQPCAAEDHLLWLADIEHWRDERRIRIGYNGERYELPELLWTRSSFMQPQMMVQDRYLLRSGPRQIHGRSLPERPAEALRRNRCRADLAHLSEHGHRQSQSARHDSLHARRRCRRSPDGRRLSSPRRARAVSDDDVGPGHA